MLSPSRSAIKANTPRPATTTSIFSSFLLPVGEAAFGAAGAFLFGTDFCGALACGVVTLILGVAGGGASMAGTAKLALQAGHSMV